MTSRILVALRVAAIPERAFEVFTRDIALWWRPNPMFAFTPRSPGVLTFEPPTEAAAGQLVERLANGKLFVIGEVKTWDPGRRLVFGWRQATFAPGQETQVCVTFEPVGNETRVTVEHTGWDTVPTEHAARHGMALGVFQMRHAEWWRVLLTSLGEAAHDR